MWTLKPEVIPLVSEVPEQHGKITESGSLPDLYTQIKRYKSTYLHLKVYGISDIARRSLLSDEYNLSSHKMRNLAKRSTGNTYYFTLKEKTAIKNRVLKMNVKD
jgi:hypothetical protein